MGNKIANYFFPLEEGEKLSVHDGLFFFGGLASMIAITVFTVIAVS